MTSTCEESFAKVFNTNFRKTNWLVAVDLYLIKPCWSLQPNGEISGKIYLDVVDSNILDMIDIKQVERNLVFLDIGITTLWNVNKKTWLQSKQTQE